MVVVGTGVIDRVLGVLSILIPNLLQILLKDRLLSPHFRLLLDRIDNIDIQVRLVHCQPPFIEAEAGERGINGVLECDERRALVFRNLDALDGTVEAEDLWVESEKKD